MENKNVKIELIDYDCSDCATCFEEYGTITKVNGKELYFRNTERGFIIKAILEELGFIVELIERYEE